MSPTVNNPAAQSVQWLWLRGIMAAVLGKDTGRDTLTALGPRLARGAFWALAGAAAARLAGLLAAMLVARVLGRTDFGKLGMILSTVGMFGTFAGFGLGIMASKHVAEFRTTDPARAGRIITLSETFAFVSGMSMAISLVLLAPVLATGSLASPEMTQPLRLSALSLFLNGLVGAQTGALSGLEAFRAIAKINLLSGLATVPLMVGGALIGGLGGAVWGTILSAALNCLLNYLTMIPILREFRIPFPAPGAFREHAVLWRFSLPATIGGALVAPATWLCNTMVIHRPNGYPELGLVSAANQWRTAILFLPATVGTAFLPILANLLASNNRKAFRKTARYTVIFSLAAGAVIAVPVFTFSDFVMKGYGNSFVSGQLVLRFTVLAATLYAANNQVTRILASLGQMWMATAFDLVWAASFLIAGALLIPAYSATGFAIALLASAFPVSGIQAWYMANLAPSSDHPASGGPERDGSSTDAASEMINMGTAPDDDWI
ncbi:MAG: oligosaccharide flippase family protein [Acidobacteriia bacterium]|nr:oligosaccharide flippase family protein [Terriglobia bacterium]